MPIPPRPTLEHLVGQRGGGGFRKQIGVAVPGEREAGTLLYYLLDDIPPATLISGYVWSRFGDGRAVGPSTPLRTCLRAGRWRTSAPGGEPTAPPCR